MPKDSISRPLKAAFAATVALLCFATGEFMMRYSNRPAYIYSGWRAKEAPGPLNQAGLRGRPWTWPKPADFVVVLSGAEAVECRPCPPGETIDLMLERALRQFNPATQVVALGAAGYGQDQAMLALQEYLAQQRADLVISWASIVNDVPRNTFRTGQPRPGVTSLKPTFALVNGDVRGPTEALGEAVYGFKFTTLLMPLLVNPDRSWSGVLPPAELGAATPVAGVETRMHVDDPLDEQRSSWSVWLSPRPARVKYGIDLTRLLLRRTRDLANLHGARFVLLLTAPDPASSPTGAVALEHASHWYLGDSKLRDAAIAEIADGFDPVILPAEGGPAASPEAARLTMARLAEALNQRNLLNAPGAARPRH